MTESTESPSPEFSLAYELMRFLCESDIRRAVIRADDTDLLVEDPRRGRPYRLSEFSNNHAFLVASKPRDVLRMFLIHIAGCQDFETFAVSKRALKIWTTTIELRVLPVSESIICLDY